jgi:hypothetical protein
MQLNQLPNTVQCLVWKVLYRPGPLRTRGFCFSMCDSVTKDSKFFTDISNSRERMMPFFLTPIASGIGHYCHPQHSQNWLRFRMHLILYLSHTPNCSYKRSRNFWTQRADFFLFTRPYIVTMYYRVSKVRWYFCSAGKAFTQVRILLVRIKYWQARLQCTTVLDPKVHRRFLTDLSSHSKQI